MLSHAAYQTACLAFTEKGDLDVLPDVMFYVLLRSTTKVWQHEGRHSDKGSFRCFNSPSAYSSRNALHHNTLAVISPRGISGENNWSCPTHLIAIRNVTEDLRDITFFTFFFFK
jgi:hypothetical protein